MNQNNNVLTEKLISILGAYVRAVLKEQLKTTGEIYTIGYGPDWREGSELAPSVSEKFGIRTYFVDRQRSDMPVSVLFALTGKLGEVFEKNDFAPFLHVTLEDNGDDFFEFRSVGDVIAVKHCSPLFKNQKNKDRYADFVEAVEKNLLFTTIKYS
jgi:hypothetical protein